MDPEAEVVGDTKGQMRIGMPMDVEPLRIVEHLFVAVGRRVVHRYFVACCDACTRELGIDHVTITMNYVDPEVGVGIYAWVAYAGEQLTGVVATRLLLDQQLAGLRALVAAGVLVKINSVMIPGINDAHLPEVARMVKAEGAFVHNVLPLISEPEHGTYFGLTGQRGPTAKELKALHDACEVTDGPGAMQIMRHCRQCRADAVGMLGADEGESFSPELYLNEEGRRFREAGEPPAGHTSPVDVQIDPFGIDSDQTRDVSPGTGPFGPLDPLPDFLR